MTVRTGHVAGSAVLFGEVIEQPRNVADKWDFRPRWYHVALIGMQLHGLVTRFSDIGAEVRNQKTISEHVAHKFECLGSLSQFAEYRIEVEQMEDPPIVQVGVEGVATGGYAVGFAGVDSDIESVTNVTCLWG